MTDGVGSGSHYFALPEGSKLYEFEIEAVLGHGGFGITYRATDTLLQETVAIKEFLPNEVAVRISDSTIRAKSERDQPDFETGLKSFLEEARMMARFRHLRIVHVRRFFELHGTGYIVLDYERGKTLSEHLSEGPLPEAELRDILSGVLDGLEVVHDRAILHRDLKPNNIMLREDGAPVIIDFGAARDFKARHSRSVTAIATAGYASPEQYGVGGQQGPWSDLYALGAIAYRAVSGATPVDSLRRLRNDPLVPAVTVGAGKYDNALLRTIDWMLKIDEADRPASVAQVREALHGGVIPQTRAARPAFEGGPVAPVSPGAILNSDSDAPKATHAPLPWRKMAAIAGSLLVLAIGSYTFYASYQAKQLAQTEREQQVSERQRLLEELLSNAGTDPSKLEQFLAICGSSCPDNLRTQAQARIELTKQARQTELARQDEASYRLARGNLGKLRAYDTNCTVCTFRQAARSEIASIEQGSHPLSVTEERSLRSKDALRECDRCPQMVVVPAGSFTMGSPDDEKDRTTYEGPKHRVTIGQPFAVGLYAVTFDEWDVCVAEGGCRDYKPSDQGWGRGRRPVVNVSWDDAKSYVHWLSDKTGKPYRLLSEAEREYVARAGTSTPFWWGSDITSLQANYDVREGRTYTSAAYREQTLPVDFFKANEFGLYQVHGNVWEWTEDCWHSGYNGAPTDGSAWIIGECRSRILRGGSWNSDPWHLRSAYRMRNLPDVRSASIGFRVARTLTP